LPVGVEVVDHSETPVAHARVWAPGHTSVELVTDDGQAFPLESEANGYFSGEAPIGPGAKYRFRLDGGDAYPDPASRFQPEGPEGPSMLVDHSTFEWGDAHWRGLSLADAIIYEMHVGTFTKAGTFRAAIERLPDLVDLGVNCIEIMPVADFVGQFGWGYDGVDLFAPSRLYGSPDDLRALVDAAHRLDIAVILDVVYNHFGPVGNYLPKFSEFYFSKRPTDWGAALNFDGEGSQPVRQFFRANARYWIEEFHFDGLRLDATQQIFDESEPNIIAEVAAEVREAAGDRKTIIVAENETQLASLVRTGPGGCGLDGVWNDDFHHSARVAASGRAEAYFEGYRGAPQEFVSAAKYGYLYQGIWYAWQKQRRGTPSLDLSPSNFVVFVQNHDQIANSANGRRLHQETSPGRHRTLTALTMLMPQVPMLFQGQEFSASAPFYYFADHEAELAKAVRDGRAKFVTQFPSLAAQPPHVRVPDPANGDTFVACKLDWSERGKNRAALALHRDLIQLRKSERVFRAPKRGAVDGAVIGESAFVLRYFADDGDDRLVVVNLGPRLHADPLPEPLLVAPHGRPWRVVFSTESEKYDGWGVAATETENDGWWLAPESLTFLAPS
jgi:maltooligosyltrehalose trehalohydrolase